MASGKANLIPLVKDILDLDPGMRFAAVINLQGGIREAIMKKGKTSLKSQKEEEHFCQQVAQRRKMRREFDKSLGKVTYVHVERDKVSQMVIYTPRNTVYFTIERDMPIAHKIQIVEKVKEITNVI